MADIDSPYGRTSVSNPRYNLGEGLAVKLRDAAQDLFGGHVGRQAGKLVYNPEGLSAYDVVADPDLLATYAVNKARGTKGGPSDVDAAEALAWGAAGMALPFVPRAVRKGKAVLGKAVDEGKAALGKAFRGSTKAAKPAKVPATARAAAPSADADNAASYFVSREAAPGKTTGHLQGALSASPQRKEQFHQTYEDVLAPGGVPSLAVRRGARSIRGPGVFQGRVSPGSQDIVPTSGNMIAEDLAQADAMNAATGLLLGQDAAAWNAVRPGGTGAFEVDLGGTIDDATMQRVVNQLHTRYADPAYIPTPEGLRVLDLNFGSPGGDPRQTRGIETLLRQTTGVEPQAVDFAGSGYIDNPWDQRRMGAGYLDVLYGRAPGAYDREPSLVNLERARRLMAPAMQEMAPELADRNRFFERQGYGRASEDLQRVLDILGSEGLDALDAYVRKQNFALGGLVDKYAE